MYMQCLVEPTGMPVCAPLSPSTPCKDKRLHFAGRAVAGLAIKSALQIYDQRIALCGFYQPNTKRDTKYASYATRYPSHSHLLSFSLSLFQWLSEFFYVPLHAVCMQRA